MNLLNAERIEQGTNELLARGTATETVWITDEEPRCATELVKTMSVQPPRGAGRVRCCAFRDRPAAAAARTSRTSARSARSASCEFATKASETSASRSRSGRSIRPRAAVGPVCGHCCQRCGPIARIRLPPPQHAVVNRVRAGDLPRRARQQRERRLAPRLMNRRTDQRLRLYVSGVARRTPTSASCFIIHSSAMSESRDSVPRSRRRRRRARRRTTPA